MPPWTRLRDFVATGPTTVAGRQSMLQRVRWRFVLLAFVSSALALTSVPQLEVAPVRVVGYLVASAGLGAWALAVYRTAGRVRALDAVGPLLVAVIGAVAGDAAWAFGPLYLALFLHSLYGSRRRVLGNALLHLAGFEAAVALAHGPTAVLGSQFVGSAVAVVVMAWVMATMAAALHRNDLILAREGVLVRASSGLVGAVDAQQVAEVAVSHVAELAGGERGELRVTLWRRDGDTLACVAVEGVAPEVERVDLGQMPPDLVGEFFTGPLVVLSPELMAAVGLAAGLERPFPHGVAVPTRQGSEVTGALVVETQTALAPDLVGALTRFADEVALADRAQRHRRLLVGVLDNSADGIVLVDPTGHLAFVSPSVVEMSGRSIATGDPLGALLERVCPEPTPVVTLDDLVVAGTSLVVRHADGRRIDVEVTMRAVADEGTVLNVRDVSEHRRLQAEISHRAFFDAVTELPNRALFYDRLEHALARATRDGTQVAVALLDLDDFKAVNDTWGHLAGDDLLRHIAGRISSAVRTTDTVARLGGDEFAVLLEGAGELPQAGIVLESVLAEVRRPLELAGQRVTVHASAGVAVSTGSETADDLLGAADMAMYAAKTAGKDTVVTFRAALREQVEIRRALRDELVVGLERGEFRVHYQPIMAIAGTSAVGVEALVRWQHPSRGHLPPADFVPLAEETGLVVPLGRWVLDQACRDLSDWTHSGQVGGRFQMHVNVSVCQLGDDRFVEDVQSALERHDVDPGQLVLEVTETALASDPARAGETLRRLHRLGVAIAIDDFGTGYASFSYLRQFPVDIVKIDRSFVGDLLQASGDTSLARAIVDLAGSLGLITVAEGVEDESTRELLDSWGCGQAQGWLWSRAVDAAELRTWLAAAGTSEPRPEAVSQS